MSDADDQKSAATRPNRMSGLIAPKGNAPRPAEQSPSRQSTTNAVMTAAMGSKSLTLRLPEAEYERLRAYAFANRKTHQAVLADALQAYLDANTSLRTA